MKLRLTGQGWALGARRAVLTLALPLAACATSGPPGGGINDPYEQVNRAVFEFNRGFDRALFRPVSQGYGVVFPGYVRDKVNNIQYHFSLPAEIVNAALQGQGENAGHNFFRFLLNSTLGVLGIFDPATSFGLERRATDFGETLYVWGVGEGAFVMTPFFGPYTQRSLTGDVVDLFLNPLSIVGLDAPGSYVSGGSYVLEAADQRYRFADSVDSVLYESADGYAQSRLIYLDNRRFQLGRGATGGDRVVDPYTGPGAAAGGGEVIDPYAEPTDPAPSGGGTAAAASPAGGVIDPYEEIYGE